MFSETDEIKSEEDYPANNENFTPISFDKKKVKKRRKRKTPKNDKALKESLKNINFEQFNSSDPIYNAKTASDENYQYDINQYQDYEKGNCSNYQENFDNNDYYNNGSFNNYFNDYELYVEELFEEMVCKIGDYLQNSINDLIDNFCYDLLYLLDDSTYIDECVNEFCEEINEEVSILFKEVNENELPRIEYYEEDADSLFEPFSDPFFAVFLDAHDFSEVDPTPRVVSNRLRNIRSKVSAVARETKKRLENSYSNITMQFSQIDEIQNAIDRVYIQNDVNQAHVEDLRKQSYRYLCQSKILEAQIETISNKLNFYSCSPNQTTRNSDNITKEDLSSCVDILSKDIHDYLNDQISFKKDFADKQSQLKKYRTNAHEMHKDLFFINEVVCNNLDRLNEMSVLDFDFESIISKSNDNIAPKSVQLRSFEDSSFLDFKLKCHKMHMDKEQVLGESQLFLKSIQEDNEFYSKL